MTEESHKHKQMEKNTSLYNAACLCLMEKKKKKRGTDASSPARREARGKEGGSSKASLTLRLSKPTDVHSFVCAAQLFLRAASRVLVSDIGARLFQLDLWIRPSPCQSITPWEEGASSSWASLLVNYREGGVPGPTPTHENLLLVTCAFKASSTVYSSPRVFS